MAESLTSAPQYWVGFAQVPFIGPTRLSRLRERFGTLDEAWRARPAALRAVLDERAVESLLRVRAALDVDRELERIHGLGIEVLAQDDPGYPFHLAQIPAPPPVLYLRGALLPADRTAVAIVGTRRATSYGRAVAARLAGELAEAGITIVSGLALGVDGAAHDAALRAGGRTLAVLGSGLDIIYPGEHRRLAERIAEQGALLSDYAPGRKPDARNFPARNRIISGLSRGVIVVEAPERSGALITADFAADQGRDVMAVPGSILTAASAGCHRLLRDGAKVVTGAADVLAELGLDGDAAAAVIQQPLPLDEDERLILALLTGEPQHIDEVAAASQLPIAKLGGLLTTMELKGSIRNAGAQHYARA